MTEPDIVAFLTRCLDEDQQRAEACAVPGGWQIRESDTQSSAEGEWTIFGVTAEGTIAEIVGDGWEGGGVWQQPDAEFIAANSPARVLADIAAKRQLLKVHAGDHVCAGWEGESYFDDGDGCLTARLMAAPYADRPGYNPAWGIG
jgi:hypothetical protein